MKNKEHIKIKNKVKKLIDNGQTLKEISMVMNIPLGKDCYDKKTIKWYWYCITRAYGGIATHKKHPNLAHDTGVKIINSITKEERSRRGRSGAISLHRQRQNDKELDDRFKKWCKKGGYSHQQKYPGKCKEYFKKGWEFVKKSKGKTKAEIYGEKRAEEIIEKGINTRMKNNSYTAWNKGLHGEEYLKHFKIHPFVSNMNSPNNLEKMFNNECKKYNLPVKFVGSHNFWITLPKNLVIKYDKDNHIIYKKIEQFAKNPDFIVVPFSKTRKVIELLGRHWHKDEDEYILKQIYKKLNIECLIIWEDEFYNNMDDIMKKVVMFIRQRRGVLNE